MRIKSATDFWAGVMFIGFGASFVIAAADYPMGSLRRMGPGYFPSMVAGLMAGLGVILLARSLAVKGARVPAFHPRPLLLILAAIVAFAVLLRPLGLVVTIVVVTVTSRLGGQGFGWKSVALLCAVLAAFSVVVFVKALTLPFPVWPAFME